MNTLKIVKGQDINLFIDEKQLFFVTSFLAEESSATYSINEFLCEDAVDVLMLDKNYKLTIKALSHLKPSAFGSENFTLRVQECDTVYEYYGCKLINVQKEVVENKPVTVVYTISAQKMVMS